MPIELEKTVYRLPLTTTDDIRREAVLSLPDALTEEEWSRMIGIIYAMKPGLMEEGLNDSKNEACD